MRFGVNLIHVRGISVKGVPEAYRPVSFFPAVATSSAAPILFMRLGPIRSPFRDPFSVSSVHGVLVGHTSYTFCPRAKIGFLVRPPTPLSLLFAPPPTPSLSQVISLYFCVSTTAAAVAFVPYAVSAVLPTTAFPWLLTTWFFRCALVYHDYEEVWKEGDFWAGFGAGLGG